MEDYYLICIEKKRFQNNRCERGNGTVLIHTDPQNGRRGKTIELECDFFLSLSSQIPARRIATQLPAILQNMENGQGAGTRHQVAKGISGENNDEIERLKTSLKKAEESIGVLKEKNTALTERIRTLKEDNADLQAKLRMTNTAMQSPSADIEEMNYKLNECKVKNLRLSEELEAQKQAQATLDSRNEKLEAELETMKDDAVEMRSTLNDQACEIDNLKAEVNQLIDNNRQKGSECERMSEQIRGMEVDLNRYESIKFLDIQKMFLTCISEMYKDIQNKDDIDRIRKSAEFQVNNMLFSAPSYGIKLTMHSPGDDAEGGRMLFSATGDKTLDGKVRRTELIGCEMERMPKYSFDETVLVWKYDPALDVPREEEAASVDPPIEEEQPITQKPEMSVGITEESTISKEDEILPNEEPQDSEQPVPKEDTQ